MSSHGRHPWPSSVSPSGRYIADRQGRPWFWLGDTAWALVTRCTPEQVRTYVRDRAVKGFTAIQTVIAWSDGTGSEAPTPWPNHAGHTPWRRNDPAMPNPAYFDWVEEIVEVARKHGIVMALLPTWGYFINNARLVTLRNARAYGRWLGRRFKDHPNIVWVCGGDRIPISKGRSYVEVHRALGRGLRDGDGGAHLIAYHPCGWTSSSSYFHSDDWLDMNMIETYAKWNHTWDAVLSDAMARPSKPVILGEGSYEDGNYWHGMTTPLIARRQAWWTHMAGGYHTYGHSRLWRLQPGWESGLNAPGAAHMGYFRTLANSRPWWDAVPYQGIFEAGVSSGRTLNAAIRAVDGSWAMAYLSSQCHVVVRLDRITTRRVKLALVNPADPVRTVDLGVLPTGNLGRSVFHDWIEHPVTVPNHWEDAVLFMDGCR